ncbi:GNAT family N-acetyltransferase [Roseibium aggregatum]|uniref:GNAT family N-acetyltransferase n=1 Tax=Roseibium aggregatum TaxID=187304 RepID=A0A926P4N0_9HYPH|nr:GNAT family N-acetyltransferase [Roseibium aggregatum]MBD1546932.1 GNAT family N-acetyltransferase [Roseibium aggregatum]
MTLAAPEKISGQNLGANFAVTRYDQPTLAELKDLWSSMPGGPVSTPFQSPHVLHAIQTERAGFSNPTFSVFSIRRQDDTHPLMLVPLMTIDRGIFKVATMADLDVVDVNAPVLAKERPIRKCEYDSILDAILEKLTDVDLFDAFNLPEKIGGLDNPFFHSSRMKKLTEVLALSLDGEQSIAQLKTKSVFKEARRKGRKLAEQGVEFSEIKTAAEREKALLSLMEYKRRHLREAGITRDPWSEKQERFFKNALNSYSDGYAQTTLLALRRNDEIVAVALAFVSDSEFHGSLISMGDEHWYRYSPGSVLICKTIEWALERGIRQFYFGPGPHDYKKHFGAQTYPLGRILVPLTAKGRSYLALRALKRIKNELIQTIKLCD